MKTNIAYSLEDIQEVVEKLYSLLATHSVVTFTGPLGAGKTTLVRSLLRRCGITDVITSPTFTYVNMYENGKGETFYHFDCYRIKSMNEFRAAGFDEYIYQPSSWAFIEWPEVVEPLLTHTVCRVIIEYEGNARNLSINCIDN